MLRSATAVLLLSPLAARAAGVKAEGMVFVADSRGLSGWAAWWANLYNESLAYFTLATVLIVPTLGMILGLLTDFFMARIGINLRSRKFADH
jgi:hypothetical protein